MCGSNVTTFECGRCSVVYTNYVVLLEHLYWRHGTESIYCFQCPLKRWNYAVHQCNVLPIPEDILNEDEALAPKVRESEFCHCGKDIPGSDMVGCDGPECELQWFHFACVGMTFPPKDEWWCPTCIKAKHKEQINDLNKLSQQG